MGLDKRCIGEWMDGWMDGYMDRWMDGLVADTRNIVSTQPLTPPK